MRRMIGNMQPEPPTGLARRRPIRFPSGPMATPRLSLGRAFGASCIASAATTGLLFGVGRRAGHALNAFSQAGRILLDSRGVADLLVPLATALVGLLHHLTAVLLWGTLIALVAGALRSVARIAATVVLTAALWWASRQSLPVLGRIDLGVSDAGRLPIFVLMAVALLIGLWVSKPSRRQPG
jgi:hypothetical protein